MNAVLECREGGFGSFSHGDHDLFERDRSHVARRIDSLRASAVLTVDNDLSEAIRVHEIFNDSAIGCEPDLYEYTIQTELVRDFSCAILVLDSSHRRTIANH